MVQKNYDITYDGSIRYRRSGPTATYDINIGVTYDIVNLRYRRTFISKLGRYIMEVMEVMGNNVVMKFGSNGSN